MTTGSDYFDVFISQLSEFRFYADYEPWNRPSTYTFEEGVGYARIRRFRGEFDGVFQIMHNESLDSLTRHSIKYLKRDCNSTVRNSSIAELRDIKDSYKKYRKLIEKYGDVIFTIDSNDEAKRIEDEIIDVFGSARFGYEDNVLFTTRNIKKVIVENLFWDCMSDILNESEKYIDCLLLKLDTENKAELKIPAKYYSLYSWIRMNKLNLEPPIALDQYGDFDKKLIRSYCEKVHGDISSENFYNEYRDIAGGGKTNLSNDFPKYREFLNAIAENPKEVIKAVESIKNWKSMV
jgi:hypothetical protein